MGRKWGRTVTVAKAGCIHKVILRTVAASNVPLSFCCTQAQVQTIIIIFFLSLSLAVSFSLYVYPFLSQLIACSVVIKECCVYFSRISIKSRLLSCLFARHLYPLSFFLSLSLNTYLYSVHCVFSTLNIRIYTSTVNDVIM